MVMRSSAGTEFVELLPDRSTALRRLDQLAVTATSTQGVLAGQPCRLGQDFTLFNVMAAASESRRLLLDPDLAQCPEVIGQAATYRVEVRMHRGSLRPLLAFDDRCAVLPLGRSDLHGGAVLLRGPLANLCSQLFELMWSDACPPTSDGPYQEGLSARQLEVVQLLVQGATDHQVANRLGMSSRTVRTIVAELQRRFGTRSRMALGFELARSPR